MLTVSHARALASDLLSAELPRRWAHVNGVAERARIVSERIQIDGVVLEAAAWLHDIGYAQVARETGFHALDGARFLRSQHVDDSLTRLVAYHSLAELEAEERGLDRALRAEFKRADSVLADALCYCDMTTGPDGQQVSIEERLSEIRSRYGPHDPVTRFVDRAERELIAVVDSLEGKIAASQSR